MGYFLGWIESLTTCLLLLALVVACSARLSRRWLRILLPSVAALLPLLAGLALSVAGVFVMRLSPIHSWLFYSAFPWTVAFAIGAAILLRRGLRVTENIPPEGEGAHRPAEAWPRAKLAIATGVAILACVMTLWNMGLAAQNRLAALRAEAGALALSVAPSRPPDSENAALVYEKAFDLIGQDTRIPQYWDNADDEELQAYLRENPSAPRPLTRDDEELQAFLREHEAALRLLRRAAAMPGCYFEYALATPREQSVMYLNGMRQGARLLALDARFQAASGQAGPALADVNAIFGMARHVSETPLLINFLVTAGIGGGEGHPTLAAVLADCDPSEAELAGLSTDEVFSYWRLFRRSIRMELAFGLSVFADQPMSAMEAPVMLKDLSGYRSMMAELDKALALPYHEALGALEIVWGEADKGRWGLQAALLSPAQSQAATSAARAEALHRLDNLALAATAYRIKHGTFPAGPDDLVPEFLMTVPDDPFDAQPIRMVTTEDGILFYSIGPDMKDDGGAELSRKDKTGDLTFRLRMPAGGIQ